MEQKQVRKILAGAVFAVTFIVYWMTIAPTVTFWDCGELIAASNILGNPHPPGNPLFTLIGRMFIVILPFQEIALRMNFISILSSSLAVMVAFLFTLRLLRNFYREELNPYFSYCGGLIASFLVAFADTIWFNAVEAEVYGVAMLIVMLISWLSLHWYENRGTKTADRTLVLMAYLAFMGMGVHPFAFITIPVLGVFVLIADPGMRKNVPVLLAGVLLLSVVYALGDFLFLAAASIAISLVGWLLTKNPEWKHRWNVALWLGLVAVLGFSSYLYVPIRSTANPIIDEGEPQTWSLFREYLERKQYGSEGMLERAFHRRARVQNQLLVHPHMGYGGYMLSQYFPWKVGEPRAEDNENVIRNFPFKAEFRPLYQILKDSPRVQFLLVLLLQLPFLWALYALARRNRAIAVYAFMLYFATSYGLVFYMNFADGTQMEMRDYEYWKSTGFDPNSQPAPVHMEVRDRDYFFTPGFIYMGVLFGVAATALLQWLSRRRWGMPAVGGVGTALAALAFAVPIWSNYKENNRTGDYVPWDYAYNLLMSCRPNSILFTNGDNDTFPLWFIQEVEGVRKDVRVVNLSLVNTNWYIQQLRDHEPAMRMGFSREEIDALEPQPWRFKKPVAWSVPNSKIKLELQPRSYLKVQDIMVLHLVQNNYPERPVHFAVTVGDDNTMGLSKYTIMEGMVYTLVEEPMNKAIDVERTAKLVDSVYQFRGLGDPKVYIDMNTEGLLTNYSATNFRLVMWAQERIQDIDKALAEAKADTTGAGQAAVDSLSALRKERVAFAEKYLDLNARLLPREWRTHYYASQLFQTAGQSQRAEEELLKGMEMASDPRVFAMNLAQIYTDRQEWDKAEKLLYGLLEKVPGDFEAAYSLAEIHQRQGELRQSRDVLAAWLRHNPSHQFAAVIDNQLKNLEARLRSESTPPPPSGDTGEAPSAPPALPPVSGPEGVPGLAPASDS